VRKRRHRQVRWLHTRISEDLEDVLKREARRRRLPVSLFVRNVLESSLDFVDDILENSMAVARRSHDLARSVSGRADGLTDVYGWQEIILNREAACARCKVGLPVGAPTHRGLREQVGPAVFLCSACVHRLRRMPTEATIEEEEST